MDKMAEARPVIELVLSYAIIWWLYHSRKENQHYYDMVGKLLVAPWLPIQQ